jgi:hypothetical protein
MGSVHGCNPSVGCAAMASIVEKMEFFVSLVLFTHEYFFFRRFPWFLCSCRFSPGVAGPPGRRASCGAVSH